MGGMSCHLGFGEKGVSDDNDLFACTDEPRSGTVNADVTRTAFAGDSIRCETLAGVDAKHMNLFVLSNTRCLEQVGVDSHAAFVINVGIGDISAMDFSTDEVPESWNRHNLKFMGRTVA